MMTIITVILLLILLLKFLLLMAKIIIVSNLTKNDNESNYNAKIFVITQIVRIMNISVVCSK